MADSIQFRRGLRSTVKPLPVGMPGFVEDEERLVIGKGDGTNAELPNKADMDNVNSQMADIVLCHMSEKLNIKYPPQPLQAPKCDGTDESTIINNILDWAHDNGYYKIYFPQGTYVISEFLHHYDNTLIYGSGHGRTIIKTTSVNCHGFRSYPLDTHLHNIEIKWLSIQGIATKDDNPQDNQTYGDSGRPIYYNMVENVTIKSVEVSWFKGLGISPNDCINLHVNNCYIHNIGRDGINGTGSKKCIITNNILKNIGDDAIAVHRTTGHPTIIDTSYGVCDTKWSANTQYEINKLVYANNKVYMCVVSGISGESEPAFINGVNADGTVTWEYVKTVCAEEIIITGNICEHTGAIASIAGESVDISNNQFNFNRGIAVMVGGSTDGGNTGNSRNINVNNNIIKNLFNISGQSAILIMNKQEIAVDTHTGGDFIKPEDNLDKAFYAYNLKLDNNTIMQEVKEGTYATDWTGTNKQPLSKFFLYGIKLEGNVKLLSINGNTFYRLNTPIYRQQVDDSYFGIPKGKIDELFVKNNSFIRCVHGINIGVQDTDDIMYIKGSVANNYFNLDPYHENGGRNPSDGSWKGDNVNSLAMFFNKMAGLIVENNTMRNLQYPCFGSPQLFKNNIIYAGTVLLDLNYTQGAFWKSSKKILEDGNPNSPTFGNILGIQQNSSPTVPTSGLYTIGDRIYNSSPATGSPKSWVCTVTGTPGTFVSEGTL